MTRWLAGASLFLAVPALATPEPIASVTVTRDGNSWTADYVLHEQAPVWAFAKSILPRESKQSWRAGAVKVLTPGVRLRRIGHYDALVSNRGALPKRVKLSFIPYLKDVEAGYDPALALSDGSVALYAGQFKILPLRSVSRLRRIPAQDDKLPSSEQPTRATFVDRSGPVLVHGKRESAPSLDQDDSYVLFGSAQPIVGEALTTILDPALPRWIADYMNSELPKILDRYQTQLGPSPVGQPTLLVSWAGPTPNHISLGGSVLTGMVVMTLEGAGILKPSEKVGHYARWFVSHEAAHFWLGQAVAYSDRSESWITEGGAELLAFRATAAADPTFNVKSRLSEARDECAPFLMHGGIASAFERPDDFRAYYACGAIIALAAERASRGDFADFVKTLIARSGQDGIVTRAEWLALLDERSPGLSRSVANLLDKSHSDGTAALAEFIRSARIESEFA